MPTFVDTGTVPVDKNNLKIYREALARTPSRSRDTYPVASLLIPWQFRGGSRDYFR